MQINGVSNINQVTNQSSKVTSKVKTVGTSFDSILKKETTSLEDIFEKAADKYNVDIDLLKAIAKQESNFNPKAESHSGAQGVMQLMPATAKSLGVTDSFDAEQNIMGGAKYISSLLDKYNGDTKLALAAYNAGMGNVSKYGGIPPI
ncbi:MAG TPA: transglycosylase SLT domain-containing protein [Lachnospiraceae bacterium]|nr:transglycosylase SLT domain-containing protein [Lachnospiraceae bacterium]